VRHGMLERPAILRPLALREDHQRWPRHFRFFFPKKIFDCN
jgi:hypothetical protein